MTGATGPFPFLPYLNLVKLAKQKRPANANNEMRTMRKGGDLNRDSPPFTFSFLFYSKALWYRIGWIHRSIGFQINCSLLGVNIGFGNINSTQNHI